MDVLETILRRRTIQSFSSEKISEDKIRESVRAAIHAPNHKLTFPWIFVWVEDSTRRRLADVQADLKSRKKGGEAMSPVEREAVIKKFLEAPVLLMAVNKKSSDANQAEEDYAAMACAIQNMALYLWSEGIGLKWGSGGIIRDSRAYEILSLNPQEHKICGTLWIGKARMTPPEPKRPAIEQFLIRR